LVNSNNIILLTYTKNAKEHMKNKLKSMIDSDLSFIGTIHALAFKFIYDVDNFLSNNFYCPDELLSIFKKMLQDILNKKRYNSLLQTIKYLFIDEFQDIDQKKLDIINLIQQISNCNIVYFGDSNVPIKYTVSLDG
jgi:superfamily I DNA/RNA helicase